MDPGWYPDPFSSGGYVRWWDGERWGPSTLAPTAPDARGAGTPTSGSTEGPPGPPVLPTPPPWPATTPTHDATVAPFPVASWGQRAGAIVVDWIIEGLLATPFVLWIAGPAVQRFVDSVPEGSTTIPQASMDQLMQDSAGLSMQLTLVSVLVTFVYQVPQNAIWNRTVGKRVIGLRIRPFAEDGSIGWGTAILRWGAYTAGSLVLRGLWPLIDYLWPLWDRPWRQTLHDKVARTLVVPHRAPRSVDVPTTFPPPRV
jgi:uncharacterized RDD family membrane protein YckC